MSTLDCLFRDGRNTGLYNGVTRYFFRSGLVLLGAAFYSTVWCLGAQWLTGDDLWAIDTPADAIRQLRGGSILVCLGLIGCLWLFMTGFFARGAALRERDNRIKELEARLNVKT